MSDPKPVTTDFWKIAQIMKVLDRVALDAKNGNQVCDVYAFDILKISFDDIFFTCLQLKNNNMSNHLKYLPWFVDLYYR